MQPILYIEAVIYTCFKVTYEKVDCKKSTCGILGIHVYVFIAITFPFLERDKVHLQLQALEEIVHGIDITLRTQSEFTHL